MAYLLWRFPEEIFCNILSFALSAPDDLFCSVEPTSPFSTLSETTSHLLLVNKTWLRIATPLLYELVVLRSKGQASALATVLKKNKALGGFIRRLRVEGGLGASLSGIIAAAPNITDIWLTFAIYATDSTAGLCRSLSSIRPTRVVLTDNERIEHSNKHANLLVDVVCDCMKNVWSVQTLVVSCHWFSTRGRTIANALLQAPNLKTLRIEYTPWTLNRLMESGLVDKTTISRIELVQPHNGWMSRDNLAELVGTKYATLKDKVTIVNFNNQLRASKASKSGNAHDGPGPPVDRTRTPWATASDAVRELLWTRILYFATAVDFDDPATDSQLAAILTKRAALCRVSKMFKTLAQPLLRDCILVRPGKDLQEKAALIAEDDAFAKGLRAISISARTSFSSSAGLSDSASSSEEEYPIEDDDDNESDASGMGDLSWFSVIRSVEAMAFLDDIAPRVPNLVHFYCGGIPRISWTTFDALCQTAGAKLRVLHCGLTSSPAGLPRSASIFGQLRTLRLFRWDSDTSFDPSLAQELAMPLLEEIGLQQFDDTFLQCLSRMKLLALRKVELVINSDVSERAVMYFLESHPTIQILTINARSHIGLARITDACPVLEEFTFMDHHPWCHYVDYREVDSNLFSASQIRPAFCRLILSVPLTVRSDSRTLLDAVQNMDFDMYPNFSELSLTKKDWPTIERDIKKDQWTQVAETLLERGIQTVDRQGWAWRKRLTKTR